VFGAALSVFLIAVPSQIVASASSGTPRHSATRIAPSGARATGEAETLYPLPAPAVQPEPCPPPPIAPGPPGPPLPPPSIKESAIPLAAAPVPRVASLLAISGKGIWLANGRGTSVDVSSIVHTAHAAGLKQIWIRTGSTTDGYYGAATLKALIPAAHAVGISVIAWDFPTLSNPAVDATRAVAALQAGVDAFAVDIESNAEGTYLTARRVGYYLSLVRAASGTKPIIGVVPPPNSYWSGFYPYTTEARFVDAFAPMVYWSCTEPGAAVNAAITFLAKLKPVAPIGQDYNMASEGGRHGLPTGQEIWRFLDVAHRDGAIGASLYDLEDGGRPQLRALHYYPW
jgi:hypothetical protein